MTINTLKIKSHYLSKFPNCEIVKQINDITYSKLYLDLCIGKDVYKTIGVNDSFIRVILFSNLSELMGINYSHFYDLWINKGSECILFYSDNKLSGWCMSDQYHMIKNHVIFDNIKAASLKEVREIIHKIL